MKQNFFSSCTTNYLVSVVKMKVMTHNVQLCSKRHSYYSETVNSCSQISFEFSTKDSPPPAAAAR